MASAADERIDVVYTWVDGAWPGYGELLRSHARDRHDLNPNRYRDNLDLLKFSLRSLEQHADFVRRVYIVTARPQRPRWLADHPDLTLVHHDELMPETELPTFNSFGIVTRLHEIPGLSARFLYMEDDRLFGARTRLRDFVARDGRIHVYAKLDDTPAGSTHHDDRRSPWDNALAYANALLDQAYGQQARASIKHAPVLFDVELFRRFVTRFADAVACNRRSKFRAPGNIAPEHMYPHWLMHEGHGRPVPLTVAYRAAGYAGLDPSLPLTAAQLALLWARKPKLYCLNDNFGERPNLGTERLVRAFLQHLYPRPSRFERSSAT